MTGQFDPKHAKSAGDGAHIVAESLDGPRGESPLTQAQRAMADNGVWLCPTCHRIVDFVRPQDFSIELLQQWKARARNWWQQNQGRSLQMAARPDLRPQVARPSPSDLVGARKFWQAHQPLAEGLWHLRRRPPSPFERDILIPEEVEHQILLMSLNPRVGKSWRDEWSSTYHCADMQMVGHMKELICCVSQLQNPSRSSPRRIDFKQHDELPVAIIRYIAVWEALGQCLHEHENWGL